MASRLVVGLFHSSGIALDAVHRLITEGIAPQEIAHSVLKEVALFRRLLSPSSPPWMWTRWCWAMPARALPNTFGMGKRRSLFGH
jgi:hypothetical protein